MRGMFGAAVIAGLMAGTPAMAQQSDVNSYLCTFAGKCGETEAADETPTKAAPQTKGFRLAASASQPTIAAPATKGFRIATGASQPVTAAPATKGFRVARSAAAAPVTADPIRRAGRAATASSARRYAAASRPAPTPGAARADLMLTFEYNSAAMTKSAETRALGFAQALMLPELKDKRFLIEGHTDAKGSRQVNVDLSRRRAQTVADFLVSKGVDRTRVEVKGVGPDEPLPGRAAEANRRVEAVLL